MSYSPDLQQNIRQSVALALAEDIGSGDITALLLDPDTNCDATIITREDCVVCGTQWVDEVFAQLGGVTVRWQAADGDKVSAGRLLCELQGNGRALLSGERTALNFLQLLSGTATTARHFADIARDTGVTILDTRKTIPGLRVAQKYAVKVGGCSNHRVGLYDAFLIKENHIAACGGIAKAIERAQALHADKPIIVEVETYAEYLEASRYPITRIMLDELSPEDLARVFAQPATVPLETSGNVDAERLAAIAKTPVQAVSSGALTKHLRAVDLSMRVNLRP